LKSLSCLLDNILENFGIGFLRALEPTGAGTLEAVDFEGPPNPCCAACRNSGNTGVTLTGRSAGDARPKIHQRDGGADADSVCRIGIYVPATWLGLGTSRTAQRYPLA
jgi:hypothetical protein